ncbi:MAG TPA: TetR/AcrR family transcriptional regulator [Thermoanaerobaculia bacterium]
MGPRERREREREEIRGKILDAARELFASEGYESVTMRGIAERIEYSPTAIYFHFKDKEALLSELCDIDFRVFAQRFAEAARIADPIERLRAAGYAYVEFGLKHPSHYRLMFMTPRPPQIESKTIVKGNPEEDAYAFLKGIVTDARAQGLIREDAGDADLASQVIWSGMHGLVALEIAKCNDTWVAWQPIEARAKLMIDVLIAGITTGNTREQ